MIKRMLQQNREKEDEKRIEKFKVSYYADKLSGAIKYQQLKYKILGEEYLTKPRNGYSIEPRSLCSNYYLDIIALYEMLRKEAYISNFISQERLENILCIKREFSFLKRLNKCIPNLAEEVLAEGPGGIAMQYVEQKQNKGMNI